MKEIERRIAHQLAQIEESFTYLGVLKNTPLMEAMQAFEKKIGSIIGLSDKIWRQEDFPERDKLFADLGEDYQNILNLIHANDALNPIYDGLKQIYDDMAQFRDMGLSLEEAKEKLKEIHQNRTSLSSSSD